MKWIATIKNVFKGIGESIDRFPLTVGFLLAVVILNAFMIENTEMDFTRLIYTFLVGAMLSVVGQMLYERFFEKITARYSFMAVSLLLTFGYYFAVGPQYEFDIAITIKTFIAIFALVIAFIWIPSINKEEVSFYQSFLAAVKAFFTALLFTGVLALGIGAIYSATNYLLFNVDPNILEHILNVIVAFFAPIYFLSMTPVYPIETEKMSRQFAVPPFLEVLISYIVVPLLAIYTMILVIYVMINFTGDFWTNNLLEPLLVSYAVIGILVLILSYNVENRLAVMYRKIFPKVLIPIVVFQTFASILKIREMGITHGRYYVILFGVFATITGLIFSFMRPKYHGYIAAVLLVLVTISIIPPIDAFTISKNNQIALLKETLLENGMLQKDEIIPNSNVLTDDRIVITKTAEYINNLGYQEEVTFLPENFNVYKDFEKTFGFNQTYSPIEDPQMFGQYRYLDREDIVLEASGTEVVIFQMLSVSEDQKNTPLDSIPFVVNEITYELKRELNDHYYIFTIHDADGTALVELPLEEVFNELLTDDTEFQEPNLSVDEATFTVENDNAKLKLLVFSLERTDEYNTIEGALFIQIK